MRAGIRGEPRGQRGLESPLAPATRAQGGGWLGGEGWGWCGSSGLVSCWAVREASRMDLETDLRQPLSPLVGPEAVPAPGPWLAVALRPQWGLWRFHIPSVKTARSLLQELSHVLGWGDEGSGRRAPEVAFGGVAFAREVIRQVLRGSPNALATFSQIGRPLVPEKSRFGQGGHLCWLHPMFGCQVAVCFTVLFCFFVFC